MRIKLFENFQNAPHLLNSFQEAEKLSDEDGIVLTGVTGDMTHVEAAIKDIPHTEAYVLVTDQSGPATSYKSDVFLVGGQKEDAMTIKEYFNKNEEVDVDNYYERNKHKIKLEEADFIKLINGEEVSQGGCQIILADFGFNRMLADIQLAISKHGHQPTEGHGLPM